MRLGVIELSDGGRSGGVGALAGVGGWGGVGDGCEGRGGRGEAMGYKGMTLEGCIWCMGVNEELVGTMGGLYLQ